MLLYNNIFIAKNDNNVSAGGLGSTPLVSNIYMCVYDSSVYYTIGFGN